MTTFHQRVLRAGVIVAAVIRRVGEGLQRLFLSKTEVARRAAEKFETLARQKMETERLDRLRNPRNYQGR